MIWLVGRKVSNSRMLKNKAQCKYVCDFIDCFVNTRTKRVGFNKQHLIFSVKWSKLILTLFDIIKSKINYGCNKLNWDELIRVKSK